MYTALPENADLLDYYSSFQRLVVASAEFVDPYVLADALFQRALEHKQLSSAWRTGPSAAVRTELQQALHSQSLTSSWAGHFIGWR